MSSVAVCGVLQVRAECRGIWITERCESYRFGAHSTDVFICMTEPSFEPVQLDAVCGHRFSMALDGLGKRAYCPRLLGKCGNNAPHLVFRAMGHRVVKQLRAIVHLEPSSAANCRNVSASAGLTRIIT